MADGFEGLMDGMKDRQDAAKNFKSEHPKQDKYHQASQPKVLPNVGSTCMVV